MPGDNIQSVGGGGGAPVVTSVNGMVGDVTVTGSGGVDTVDGQTGDVDLTGTYLALTGGTLTGALVGTLSTMTTAIRAGAANWASTGEIRLPSGGAINARNAANNADLGLISANASDQLQLGRDTVPSSDSAVNLGSSARRWATIFGVIGSFGGTTPSTSGAVRLNNADTIGWRNAANSGNVNGITVNSSDQVVHGATTVPDGDNTRSLGTSAARWSTIIGVSVQVGTNPAATGSVRIASTGQINWRNAANNADVGGFSTNASDQLTAATTLVPSTDSAKDLGATALRWANIFGVIGVFGSATNVASAGALRFANAAAVNWRNNGNSADLGWTVSSSDLMTTTAGLVAPHLAPASTTGATTAMRYFRGTASGAPASGTWVAGDIVPAADGTFWFCTVGGTPGTWVQSGSATYAPLTSVLTKTGGGLDTVNNLGNITGATTANLANGNMQYGTLTGNVTFTFSGATNGSECEMVLSLTQDGTGSRTITWPAAVKWAGGVAPTISTAASANDQFVFRTRDGGTTWYGALIGKGFA